MAKSLDELERDHAALAARVAKLEAIVFPRVGHDPAFTPVVPPTNLKTPEDLLRQLAASRAAAASDSQANTHVP